MTKLFETNEPRPPFIPGLELAEGLFRELVRPMFDAHIPEMSYTAAAIGSGSDILGFDTEMSADHDWGPRAMVFLREEDIETMSPIIRALSMKHLPLTYRGYPLRIYAREVKNPGARMRQRPNDPGLEPRIEIYTIQGFFQKELGVELDKPLTAADWLTMTHHRLRSVVDGSVFHDDLELQSVRGRFAWYPHDIWLYVLASCWARMGIDETLTGRAGTVGDDVGSQIIAWRIVRDIMRLAFLMERRYPPYPKWFGSAFKQLQCAPVLLPLIERVGAVLSWEERDRALADCYRELAEMHNALRITPSVPSEPMRWWARPFTVSRGGAIVGALRKEIQDPSVRTIAERWMIGNIDLFNDNHLFDDDPKLRPLLFSLFE
jgi:hypothetical protein